MIVLVPQSAEAIADVDQLEPQQPVHERVGKPGHEDTRGGFTFCDTGAHPRTCREACGVCGDGPDHFRGMCFRSAVSTYRRAQCRSGGGGTSDFRD